MIETDREVVMAIGESVLVDPVYHTLGELNIADVATRGKADTARGRCRWNEMAPINKVFLLLFSVTWLPFRRGCPRVLKFCMGLITYIF